MDRLRLRAIARVAPRRFAGAVAETVKEMSRRSPAPRDMPFLRLDLPAGCGGRLLERLSELGIFRVYERVLEVGGGLGGASRWLARRRGCRVLAVEERADLAAASAMLATRADLGAQARSVCGSLGALPVAGGAFTHAWSVERLHEEKRKREVFAETFRAVRPGGWVAVQDWMLAHGESPSAGFFEPARAYADALTASGFVGLEIADVEDLAEGDPALTELAWQRLGELPWPLRAAEARAVDDAARLLHERDELVRSGGLRRVRILGRKPA